MRVRTTRTDSWILAFAAIVLAWCALPALAVNIDPADDGSKYAWSENTGWINAKPGGDTGNGVHVVDDRLTGWMWSENTGWISMHCENTSSCGTVSYGVTNDATGNLGGYAWAENAGWISLSCDNTASCGTVSYGVTIDGTTGDFAGYAWSENLGWIRFASAGPNPYRVNTSWRCSGPTGTASLLADKSGADLVLQWSAVPSSTAYDVVRGDLDLLLDNAGDFSLATTDCVADDDPATSVVVTGTPAPGAGYWILVRPVGCAAGSYDSSGPSQAAPRDGGIATSGFDCP